MALGGAHDPDEVVVGAGQRLQDLVELALDGRLLAGLGVLEGENHDQSDCGGKGFEDGEYGSHPGVRRAAIRNAALISRATVLSTVLWEKRPSPCKSRLPREWLIVRRVP
jgi:hypothetical protein